MKSIVICKMSLNAIQIEPTTQLLIGFVVGNAHPT
jgi:hypothetical protein